MKKIWILLAMLGLLGSILLLGLFSRKGAVIELVVWGPLEASNAEWERTIRTYEEQNPGVRLVYRRIPFDEYRQELIEAFANREAPDVFYLHDSEVATHKSFLFPMPADSGRMTYRQFSETFVDATQIFTDGEHILAIPLFTETLALFYNKELVSEPPLTWEVFDDLLADVTVTDANGAVVRAGAAIGTAENINRASDLFALFAMQRLDGLPLINPDTGMVRFDSTSAETPAGTVLTAYTNYASPIEPIYTWNQSQWYSIDAFIDGQVAMMFSYPHHIATVQSRAPDLDFGIALMPQTADLHARRQRVDYASSWGLGVATTSPNTEAAWDFVAFMGEQEQQREALVRYTPEPIPLSAHRDVLSTLLDDSVWGVFAQQALSARTWYRPDGEAVEVLVEDAIEAVLSGARAGDVTKRLEVDIRSLAE